jgi:hypothetical protein
LSCPDPVPNWTAPAVYGLFFLFLAFSTALESKFVLPKAIVLSAGVLAPGVLLIVRIWRVHRGSAAFGTAGGALASARTGICSQVEYQSCELAAGQDGEANTRLILPMRINENHFLLL